jgi:hypothetical protein
MSESHGHHVCRVDKLVNRFLYEILRLVPCQGCYPENMKKNYIDCPCSKKGGVWALVLAVQKCQLQDVEI